MPASSLPPAVSRPRTPTRTALTPRWWFEGQYTRIGRIPDSNVVVLERSAVASGTADVAAVFGPAEEALHGVKRENLNLLIDVRLARGRNDAAFEKQFEPCRQRMQRGFRRVAVVVATPHGKLQVQRYAREDGTSSAAFDDYDAAVAWLRG